MVILMPPPESATDGPCRSHNLTDPVKMATITGNGWTFRLTKCSESVLNATGPGSWRPLATTRDHVPASPTSSDCRCKTLAVVRKKCPRARVVLTAGECTSPALHWSISTDARAAKGNLVATKKASG